MDKKMEHEMETGVIKGLYRDPSLQIIPKMENQMEKKMMKGNWGYKGAI